MICDIVLRAAAPLSNCEETENGARIETTCLYPSFDPVAVYVIKIGDGFVVHDGGGAVESALRHGRSPFDAIAAMRVVAERYWLDCKEGRLWAKCSTEGQLVAAIMAVANASSGAAEATLASTVQEDIGDPDLKEEVKDILLRHFSKENVGLNVYRVGRSGKRFKFDFAVSRKERIVLVDAVSPSSVSIAFKYTAFSNVRARELGGAIAVYSRPLKDEDSLMLSDVADVVPLGALATRVETELYSVAA